jgi:photosystem II stability/assembly factor-like uncharacterized protein
MNLCLATAHRLLLSFATAGVLVSVADAQPVWNDIGTGCLLNMRGGSTGRVSAIACDPADEKTIYIGTPGGGVWKSVDAGATWIPLTDSMPCNSIGSIALDPKDSQTIYVGTGEANGTEHSGGYGLGVYRSNDGGATWVQLPRSNGQHDPSSFDGRCVGRILVDSNDRTHLLAAVSRSPNVIFNGKGHPLGATGAVGVYSSHDSGETWSAAGFPVNSEAWDVVQFDGTTKFVASTDNGIFVSVDGGSHWQGTAGGPSGTRTSLATAPTAPGTVFAANAATVTVNNQVQNAGLALYRSTTFGATWEDLHVAVDTDPHIAPWYTQMITVDRTTDLVVYFGCLSLYKATYDPNQMLWAPAEIAPQQEVTRGFHEDQHAAAWDAGGRLLVGNDGGLIRAQSSGIIPMYPPLEFWEHLDSSSLGITQVLPGLSVDPNDGNHLCAGTQDNSDMERIADTREWLTPDLNFVEIQQGDGGYTAIDPWVPSTVIVGTNSSTIWMATDGGSDFKRHGPSGGGAAVVGPPFVMDPTPTGGGRARVIYGATRLCKLSQDGTSLSPIGIDFPQNCRARAIAVAPGTYNDGVWTQYIYVALGQFVPPSSPSDVPRQQIASLLLASSDGGASYTTTQMGNSYLHWPRGTREIAVDPNHPKVAFAVSALWGNTNPRRERVFQTKDGGQNWSGCDGVDGVGGHSLPDCPVNAVAIRSVPGERRLVIVGTDQGAYFTYDDGSHWYKYGVGMPNSPIYDVVLDLPHNQLLASTMGRGVWRTTPPCLADIDDGSGTGTPDGIVDNRDFIAFFKWLANGQGNIDMDGDGEITDADIALFLAHFQSGC